jgi:type II secretory ATPase GspE/PulE/Tfp pilus assembly ATPase PilB-like protein
MVDNAGKQNAQGAAEVGSELTEVINLIHGASNVKEIILDVKEKILDLAGAERITIYAIDGNQQIFSLYKSPDGVKEIRVASDSSSMVGYAALTGKTLNIKDPYDEKELKAVNPKLSFDSSWDAQGEFKTQSVLTVPILHEKYVLGVLQLLNKKGEGPFTDGDVAVAQEIAKTLGIAFYNQKGISRTRKPHKFGYLIDSGQITEKKLQDAVSFARKENRAIVEVLVDEYHINKEEVVKGLGQYYGTGHFIFEGQTMPDEYQRQLKNPDYLKKLMVAPVARKGPVVQVAMEDPSDMAKEDFISMMQLAPRHECLVALPQDIECFINLSYGIKEKKTDMDEILGELSEDEEEVVEEEFFDDDKEDDAIVRLAAQTIRDAYQRDASDIHVEPAGNKVSTRIRFRIDGVCNVYQEIPASRRKALVSRLKIMSHLNIAERRLPQDGKILFPMKERSIELRVATIPTTGGEEDVVMRILAASEPIPLTKMGFSERNLAVLKDIVSKPYGMILCVGPTGSGKTTTLHSALGHINTPERKIWTAEDPVEITQPGLRQVQVKPQIDFTFASAMRAFLRADPDVIMVGEMRDEETAHTGIEASLTGHLVLSTLHTNSAPETITRLLDMGLDPFNFADSLLGVLAQRLVRRLCEKCKVGYNPSEEEFDSLADAYGRDLFAKLGVNHSPELTLYKPKEDGCPVCHGSGYKGRMGLHELLTGTDEIKRAIQKKLPVEQIRELAIESGMTTLMQDGVMKVIAGGTDLQQVKFVCMR